MGGRHPARAGQRAGLTGPGPGTGWIPNRVIQQ
jgi:hypothetical protein